jgi:hypothetical protein
MDLCTSDIRDIVDNEDISVKDIVTSFVQTLHEIRLPGGRRMELGVSRKLLNLYCILLHLIDGGEGFLIVISFKG